MAEGGYDVGLPLYLGQGLEAEFGQMPQWKYSASSPRLSFLCNEE